jgi:hypothetical protein
MPSLEYWVVCESAALDQFRNRPSFFHVIEGDLGREHFPWTIPQLTSFSSWLPGLDEAGHDYQVLWRIHTPGGATPRDFPKNFTQDRQRTRLLQTVYNLPIEHPGELRLELFLNGTLVTARAVHINSAE